MMTFELLSCSHCCAVFRSFLNILIPSLRADPNKAQHTNENTIETRITTTMVPSNFTSAHQLFQSFFLKSAGLLNSFLLAVALARHRSNDSISH